jgi:2C-methyl-D-erythritol 2,4-cyclodiphosphate synthase
MHLPKERIGIKATTNEQTGAIGRMEGIATFAVCCLIKK